MFCYLNAKIGHKLDHCFSVLYVDSSFWLLLQHSIVRECLFVCSFIICKKYNIAYKLIYYTGNYELKLVLNETSLNESYNSEKSKLFEIKIHASHL